MPALNPAASKAIGLRTRRISQMLSITLRKTRVPNFNSTPLSLLLIFLTAGTAVGQTTQASARNNPYSPSPLIKIRQDEPQAAHTDRTEIAEITFMAQRANVPQPQNGPAPVQRVVEVPKHVDARVAPPTEIYKVGTGDVLHIKLLNSPQGSGYYTVRPNGTIDFPLAGENVIVADRTIDEIKNRIAGGITLFSSPQLEVKVREYASHKITVSGMVTNPGDKSLQREAIPLFVIRAEAGVAPKATKVRIARGPAAATETHDLKDPNTDNILIFPGNKIEFTTAAAGMASGFYFIAGEINAPGQKDLTPGLTLYQAVLAAGGQKGNPKKATIRRKGEDGKLNAAEHNLRSIKGGKAPDPIVVPGDMIEIGK